MDQSLVNFKMYIEKLGHFWQAFNNLEIFLRFYLNFKNGSNNVEANGWLNSPFGTILPETPITDFKNFRQLCEAFNKYQHASETIDFTDISDLRDAMAHGRVTGNNFGGMSVVKYSKPQNGKVKVEYFRQLDVFQLEKIIEEMGSIGMEISKRWGAKMP